MRMRQPPVLNRRHPCMCFEVAYHQAVIREVKGGGYLSDAVVGISQAQLQPGDNIFVDHHLRRLTRLPLLLWVVAGCPMVCHRHAPARAAVHVHLHTAVPLHEAVAFHLYRLARTGLVVSFPLGADMAVQLWGALQLVGQ